MVCTDETPHVTRIMMLLEYDEEVAQFFANKRTAPILAGGVTKFWDPDEEVCVLRCVCLFCVVTAPARPCVVLFRHTRTHAHTQTGTPVDHLRIVGQGRCN